MAFKTFVETREKFNGIEPVRFQIMASDMVLIKKF